MIARLFMQNTKSIKKTKYDLINIRQNIASISECVAFAKRIDSYLERKKIFLVLRFGENLVISGSMLGFLIAKIKIIKKLQGDLIIVTRNHEIHDLLKITNVDSLVRVFPSLRGFSKFYRNADFGSEQGFPAGSKHSRQPEEK